MKWSKTNIAFIVGGVLLAAAVLVWSWTRPGASTAASNPAREFAAEKEAALAAQEAEAAALAAEQAEAPASPEGAEQTEQPASETGRPDDHLYLPEALPKPEEPPAGSVPTTTESALRAALAHAGFSGAEAEDIQVWLEYEGEKPACYTVRFRAGRAGYAYEVALNDSVVLSWQKDALETKEKPEKEEDKPARRPDIGEAKARAAALESAGLTEATARWVRVRRVTEDGRAVYRVSFTAGSKSYELEVDAKSGEVLPHQPPA